MSAAPDQTQTFHDNMDPARAGALHIALGLRGPVPKSGDTLPPFFHQIYFWEVRAPGGLGRDGHPKVGGLIPDMGLPRRMWAGGRLEFHHPLRIGMPAEKTTIVDSAERKQGRSGPLGFVTLRHDIRQGGVLAVTEFQDLVYRGDPDPQAAPPAWRTAPRDEDSRAELRFTPTLLFRYSALTFNGHRIHYDRDYARDVEGYGGLVVHGPLLAQFLMLKAEAELGPLKGFSFRATAPLLDSETATLCRKGRTLWVRGPDGRLSMEATGSI